MHTHHAHICTHAETHMCMYISCTQCTHIHTQHTSFAYPGVFPGVAGGLWRCGMWCLLTLTYPLEALSGLPPPQSPSIMGASPHHGSCLEHGTLKPLPSGPKASPCNSSEERRSLSSPFATCPPDPQVVTFVLCQLPP